MRRCALVVIVALAVVSAACAARYAAGDIPLPCDARITGPAAPPIEWVLGPEADRASLDRWCYGVGSAIAVNAGRAAETPAIDELLVVTWNAHVGQGRVTELVAAIRDGAFSDGQPAEHFVVLMQEALRRGTDVPRLTSAAVSAGAIGGDHGEDIVAAAEALDLSVLYVPSMRNGLGRQEDRGNAILSTLPLHDPLAIELPFTRQRRVAIGAVVHIEDGGRQANLLVMNVHLDPLGPARTLWIFGNPRRRQMEIVLDEIDRRVRAHRDPGSIIATVLGGDLNVLSGGVREAVYRDARRWATSVAGEDERSTHLMGRLDYLFFRFPEEWLGVTVRGESRFGSDHYPVAATFFRAAPR